MSRNEKTGSDYPMIGGSSLLVIFSVLCLTVFSMLSLSTTQADNRISAAAEEAVSAYYKADTAAEMIFARIRSGELPDSVERTGNVYSYECTISETQTLAVSVEETAAGWKVLEWRSRLTEEWEPDTEMTMWDGTFDFG